MVFSEGKRRLVYGAAAAWIAVFFCVSFFTSLLKSPTFDEPGHIAAGVSYYRTGQVRVNPQHPPLLKLLSAIPLIAIGVEWPKSEYATALFNGATALEATVGTEILLKYGVDRVLMWARLPLVLVSCLIGVFLFLWAREMLGLGPALGALFLLVLSPTMIGQSNLVTTDCGVAAFMVLFFHLLWRYLRAPGYRRMLWCGLALGAAMASKFSAIALLPLNGLLMLLALFWPAVPRGAAPVPAPAPLPERRGKKHRKPARAAAAPPFWWDDLRRYAIAGAGMWLVAFLFLQVVYFFPKDPFTYIAGYRQVNADHDPTHLVFLAGQTAAKFDFYFLAAYLLKEPIAAILLVPAGLWALWRNRSLTAMDRCFLLIPPVVLFIGYSVFADNYGVRYIIPVLPFLYLIGGAGLAWLFAGPVWTRAAAGLLCVWMAVATAGVYPDHLSYLNESACLLDDPSQLGWDGGTRCGYKWLNDSNTDWGQGTKQLKLWVDANAPGRKVKFAYFGVFVPRAYGLDAEFLQPEQLLPEPAPGLYAVSAHILSAVTAYSLNETHGEAAAWMRRIKPRAFVGHSIWVWDIPEKKP